MCTGEWNKNRNLAVLKRPAEDIVIRFTGCRVSEAMIKFSAPSRGSASTDSLRGLSIPLDYWWLRFFRKKGLTKQPRIWYTVCDG